MKAIICGGRDYSFTETDHAWLNELHERLGITEVVSGTARGADREGEVWARLNNIPVRRFFPNWDYHGKIAGFLRNEDMAEYAAGGVCIAFPGNRGTADMMNRARNRSIPVYRPHSLAPSTPAPASAHVDSPSP